MNKIIPAILANDFANFKKQLEQISTWEIRPPYVQVDIMDGQFVNNTSFSEREEINDLDFTTQIELHLMVKNPVAELECWRNVKRILRVIVHVEAVNDFEAIKKIAHEKDWLLGLAINPNTDINTLTPYFEDIDLVLFMTVQPGQQGATFLPTVGPKIQSFVNMPDRPLCAVDGGMNTENIALAKSWGAEIFCVGSAIVMSEDPYSSYQKLIEV